MENGAWQTAGSEDSEYDTTVLGADRVWTETWQFGTCDPLGTYRFRVTGVADSGAGPAPYEVASAPFQLLPTPPIVPASPVVEGGQVSVTATYADPGNEALLALPRRVRSGAATLSVNGSPLQAPIDGERLRFRAAVTPGAQVSVTGIDDGCGNTGP